MKNLVSNLRTAKAQAEGCAKVTKSSRMAKVLTTLTLLLTLGFGQMWAGAGFYEVYFTYSYSGTTSNATYTNSTSTTQTIDLGTLTADFKITSIYLKYWKDGSGNMCGGLVDYYISSDQEYQPSWTWTPKGGNNHELSSTANWTIAQYNTGASGSYTFWYRFKTWGSSSSSSGCSDNYYIPTNSNNKNKFTYNIAPPAVSGFGVSTSGFLAGSGTSSDPYLVKSGNSLTFTVSGSKARTDANSTFKYWLNSGTKKTSGTLSTGSITSTSLQSAVVHGQCINNSSSSLVGTESTSTIYYKAVSVKDISVYIYVGGRTSAEINSVEMNGCTPYVGTKALSSVKINNQSAGAPKFTLSGNWLVYTFEDVTKVSNITCARSGGNIFTGEITDNVYYMYDGTELDSQCVPRANPTWGTAPASGAIGGSMTATVSGAPDGATITWTSTNTSAATVNSSGVISYVAAGNTTIKARVQKAAGGDYCKLDYTLSQDISVTSGATVTATRTCPAYVSTGAGEVTLDITSTGASSGWYYRIKNKSTGGYYAPDNQSAASNALSWTMTGGIGAELTTLVVELYNGSNTLICTSSDVTVTGEVAHITYIAAGSNGSVSPKTIYANNNHVHPSITATPNSHYHFKEWTSNNAAASVASTKNATTTVTATAGGYTITAYFEGDQYTITYKDKDNAAYSGSNQASLPATHRYGTATALVNGVRSGYTFVGWYRNSSCTGDAVTSIGATSQTGNFTLYAKWTEVKSTVSLVASPTGAGTFTSNASTVTSLQAGVTTKPSVTANPAFGYSFSSWAVSGGATISSTSSNPTTVTGNGAGAAATLTATFARTYSYMQGRMSIYNAARNSKTHIASSEGGWDTNSTRIGLDYDDTNHRFVLHTHMKPSELTAQQNSQYQWFKIKNGSTTYAPTSDTQITTAGTKYSASSSGSGSYRINNSATSGYVVLHFDGSDVWYTLEQRLQYSKNGGTGSNPTGANGHNSYHATGTNTTAANNPYTRTGYTFASWNTQSNGNGTNYAEGANVPMSADVTLYAKWTANPYTVVLDKQTSAEGYGGNAGTVENQTVTFDATPATVSGTMPTAAQGYAFMGFYTATGGGGSKMINADGTWNNVSGYISGGKWIRDGGATLYAYFKKAEITDITLDNYMFDPVAAGGTGFVIANPTVEPTPVLPVKICWELLYDNGNSVPAGHEAIDDHDGSHPNRVKFSIAGLAAGGYKIKATLRTGDDCSGGTLLSSFDKSFTIASGYTVTIQYKDTEGNTIAPSTTSPGKATDWTSISAPTIVGYNFSTWVPGDGITLESSATTNSNRFKATFNGTLTAQYTKKGIIYFKNTLGWSDVYVNFMSGDYWNTSKGSGNGNTYHSRNNRMTLMPGTTDVYYFEYSGTTTAYVSFTSASQTADNFWAEGGVNVVFPTRPDASNTDRASEGFGYNAGTPMFVPLSGQSGVEKNNINGGKAYYFNKGYWVDYNPISHNTGYTLEIYNHANADGSREVLKTVKFYENGDGALEATVDLDAATTYAVKFLRDNNMRYTNVGGTNLTDGTSLKFEFNADNWAARTLVSTAAGSYVFKIRCNSDGYLYVTATYPAAAKDFQILYNDNAEWSLGSAHDANWVHPSRIIRARENGVDTISFFVAKDNTPILKARKVSSINASTGAITWESLNINVAAKQDLTVDSSAVYNFKVTQGATAGDIASIEYIGPYTGNYYIRCNALNSNWDNYTTDGDHRMTYSSFSESAANSFGEKYSHYKAKWCPRNTNIAFCIANDYSPCITDTLKQDVGNPYGNTDINGTLNNDGVAGHSGNNAYLDRYSANVRFMWNRKTNKISRAYVSASTSENAKFLVLQGSGATNANIYNGSTGAAFTANPPGTNSVKLSDNENWIYEVTVKANPSALVKLYANYCDQTQWFRGAAGGFTEGTTAIQILGGSASASQYSVRVIYDFKTNRLIAAWVPSGSSETIDTDLTVNADVMIVREHQESAQCITFSNNAKMTSVKNVYGVMRFNRWILNNRQHPEDQDKEHARPDHIVEDLAEHHPPLSVGQQKSTYERRLYFISFPFDVLVGDIFGFGTYGQYWVIQYYDGLNRAKKGYWMDSKPNWKYVSPTEVAQGYKLEKNQGYILELNLSAMAADNTTFWSNGISTIELYFPSTVNQETLKQTNCTIPALSDEYKCTINRGTTEGDRRVKDSYWRCIGVPSYNLYNSTLKDGSGNAITWKTDYTWHNDEREFPFIYMWNKTDNTLTPQATSTFTFQPMHAYLTQIKNAIVWTAVSAKPSSIVARRASKEATKEYNWRIELKQDTTFLDQTYVRMTDLEQVTDNFDFGQDLIKELNSRSNIYTFIGYEKVAANSMTLHTDQTTVIPVGANITTEGDYTFALPDGADGIGVTLIDAETGTHTNLSAGMDYTVYLEKGTHDNRFWLEISPIQNTPTDIELINGENGDASLNGVRKVLIDGILYIVKDGKLFDARGARLR